MNKIIYITIGALAIAVIALAIGFSTKTPVVNVSVNPELSELLGGTDNYNLVAFHAGFGGNIRATSTDDTTATFLDSDLRGYSLINFTPNITGITATLPATSTLKAFLPSAGSNKSIMICNATSTASMPFTLAFGTGLNDHLATSTLAIQSGDCGILTFYRNSDTDIEVYYDLGY